VFVSNVISGTVTRIDLSVLPSQDSVKVLGMTQIASGYTVTPNASAVVLGPTGLAFDPRTDTLYVASTGDNAIYAIGNAAFTSSDGGKGKLIFNDANHLNGPLGLVLAPNGDLITTNGDAFNPASSVPPSELVEFTPEGRFVAEFSIDAVAGSAFGIALGRSDDHLILAAVDDNFSQLDLFQVDD
jgi:sugar lactone lactonase YvrE